MYHRERERSSFIGEEDASGELRRVGCILRTMARKRSAVFRKKYSAPAGKILATPIRFCCYKLAFSAWTSAMLGCRRIRTESSRVAVAAPGRPGHFQVTKGRCVWTDSGLESRGAQ